MYSFCTRLLSHSCHRPAIRRLFDAVKRKRRRLFFAKFGSFFENGGTLRSKNSQASDRLARYQEFLFSGDSVSSFAGCLIAPKDLDVQHKLGSGTFGEVFKADWSRPDGRVREVAVKILKSDVLSMPGAIAEFIKEVTAMQELRHDNLIRLVSVGVRLRES